MSFNADQLYNLLPAVHRLRDQNAMGTIATNPTPGALRELIEIIADQVAVLEEEQAQLYDNQFVETAAPWALPYLGGLLGLTGLTAAGQNEPFAPRAEVANTVAYRRRKGTAAMLEQLARDIMGRPSAAVEFWKRLATSQHVNHVRTKNIAWTSVRNAGQLEFIGTPFEAATRTLEVRRIEPGLGKWNIPNVGLCVWRLKDYARTRSPLVASHIDDRHLRLHPLGLDVPLCARPETETDIAHLAGPENVPALLTWRLLAGPAAAGTTNQFHPADTWYGPDRSVQLWRIKDGKWAELPAQEIIVCNLRDVPAMPITNWDHDDFELPDHSKPILLDPLRGRVVLPAAEEIFATFCTLFTADIGGGEYARAGSFDKSSSPGRFVSQQPLDKVLAGVSKARIQDAINLGVAGDVIIEIADSGYYRETLPDVSANGIALELRAEDGRWPTLILEGSWNLSGDISGQISLNGLLISGNNISVSGGLGTLQFRHCTLLPGLNIGADGRVDPGAARPAALEITAPGVSVVLENCIVGPLHVAPDATVHLRNCIVDAGAKDAWAISGPAAGTPGGMWRIENCTIVGRVAARGLELASNSTFFGASISVERRQEGCVRFCWLPKNAVVPRRHKCVPRVEKNDLNEDVLIDVQPQFVSLVFGDSGYGQLSHACPDPIRLGADDESEMGVYHDLKEPRREEYLRARLVDYLRFGLDAGIFYEQNTPRINESTLR